MDAILIAGDELYVMIRTSKNAVDEDWLCPDDIPNAVHTLGLQATCAIAYVAGGTYSDRSRCLRLSDAINSASIANEGNRQKFQGFMFVGRSKTVAFWPVPDGSFIIFQSHCVTKENHAEPVADRGAARLFVCDTSIAVAKVIMANDVYDRNFWSLVVVTVSLMP